MKNTELKKRLITTVAIAAVLIPVMIFSYVPVVIKTTVALLGIAAVIEVCNAIGISDRKIVVAIFSIAAAAAPFIEIPHYPSILSVVYLAVFSCFIILYVLMDSETTRSPRVMILLLLIILFLLQSFRELPLRENGSIYLSFSVIVCAMTDVGAYLFGRSFGKHKLLVKVSPNKTVEGSVFGVFSGIITGLIFGLCVSAFSDVRIDYPLLLLTAVAVSVVGQFGDLWISLMKRICGVKDFGKILPGHGGVLDRIDSHLMAIPTVYLLFSVGFGFIV